MIRYEVMQKTMDIWRDWFLHSRLDPAVRSFVSDPTLRWIFLALAKKCGAIKGRFCADGSVMVFFKGMPK